MNIVFIPNYSKDDPYQNLLAKPLINLGVNVKIIDNIFLRDILMGEKIDLLHIHWTNFFLTSSKNQKQIINFIKSIIKILFIKLRGIKIVWTIHNLENHEKIYKYEKYFNYILYKFVNRIIVHSNNSLEIVLNYYKKLDKNKIKIIPLGHYINYYPNTVDRNEAKRILGIDESQFVFLFLGSIREYKKLPELILSFKKIADNKITLLIVGRPFNKNLQEKIVNCSKGDSRIKLIFGFVLVEKVQIYMNSADIIICPYENVLTSGSVVLAMTFAKAVIAPDIGCIPDTVDEEGGILYDIMDPNGLLNAMKKVLTISNLNSMGEKNLIKVKTFDWEQIGMETFKVYSEVLQKEIK